MRKPDPRFISVCAFSVAQAAGENGQREQVELFEGLQVGMLRASTPRGASEVWQTQDLGRCVFGSVAIVALTGEFSDVWQSKKLGENGKNVERFWRLECWGANAPQTRRGRGGFAEKSTPRLPSQLGVNRVNPSALGVNGRP